MKEEIIKAIQSQRIIRVSFQKETTGEYVIRDVMPYDIFPKKKKDGLQEEDYLLGYVDVHLPHSNHNFSTYLSNISNVEILNELFDGQFLIKNFNLIKPPMVSRNW